VPRITAAADEKRMTPPPRRRGGCPGRKDAAYNGRDAALFGNAARDYCNKCHAKD
jgi:hypothetical protein